MFLVKQQFCCLYPQTQSKPLVMPLVAPKSQTNSNYTPAPTGSHIARCFRMVDIGTHQKTYDGKTRDVRMVRLDFELPEEVHVFREEKGPEPHSIGEYFTFSMNEKAKLRILLEQWRGKKFTDQEADKFDISVLIGKTCYMNVIHNEGDGRVYANIASLMPVPKSAQPHVPAPVNPVVSFSIDDLLADPQTYLRTYLSLPEFIRKKIQASREWPKIAPLVGEDAGQDDEPQDRRDYSRPVNQGRAPAPNESWGAEPSNTDDIPF